MKRNESEGTCERDGSLSSWDLLFDFNRIEDREAAISLVLSCPFSYKTRGCALYGPTYSEGGWSSPSHTLMAVMLPLSGDNQSILLNGLPDDFTGEITWSVE